MAHHIDWLEFRSADNAATKEFYSKAFGWEFMEFADGYIFAMPGGNDAPGCGFRAASPEDTPQTVAYIHTADIDGSIEAVKAAGGTIVTDKFAIDQVGLISFFKDPSGSIVGLHQPPAGDGGQQDA